MNIEDIIKEKKNKFNYSHKQVVDYLLNQGFDMAEVKKETSKFYDLVKKDDIIYSHSFMFSFFNLLLPVIALLVFLPNQYTFIAVGIQLIVLFFYTKLNKIAIIILGATVLMSLINVLLSFFGFSTFEFRGVSLKVYTTIFLALNLICLYNVYKQKVRLDSQYFFSDF